MHRESLHWLKLQRSEEKSAYDPPELHQHDHLSYQEESRHDRYHENTYIIGCTTNHDDNNASTIENVTLKPSTSQPPLHSSLTTAMAVTQIPEVPTGNVAGTTSLRPTPSSTLSEPLQAVTPMEISTPEIRPDNIKTGVQAAKMGTTLDTTLSRLLEPGNHVLHNMVVKSIVQPAVTTATTTEYGSDGTPVSTESLHVLKNTGTLPTDKSYYAAANTSELEHWLLHKRPEYTRLHTAGYYQCNT